MPRLAPHRVPPPGRAAPPPDDLVTSVLLAELTEPASEISSSGSLWHRLERAVAAASRARAAAKRAAVSSFTGLDSAFSPHGPEARLKARSFLAAGARASAKLQAAMEELEAQAAAARAAHDDDHANWVSEQRLVVARLESAQQAKESALRHELQTAELEKSAQAEALTQMGKDKLHRMEIDHARQVHELKQQFDAERAKLHDEAAGLRTRCTQLQQEAASEASAARMSYDELLAENVALKRQLAAKAVEVHEEKALREAEQAAAATLQTSNTKLRAELSSVGSELEHSRAELRGKVERLSREKTAINGELEAQVTHATSLLPSNVSPYTRRRLSTSIPSRDPRCALLRRALTSIPPRFPARR